MLQKILCLWKKKTHVVFFCFSFKATFIFPLWMPCICWHRRVYGFYSSDSSDSFRCAMSQTKILFMEVVFTRHMKNIIKITEILSRIYSFRWTRSQNEILFMEVVFTRHLKKIIKTGIKFQKNYKNSSIDRY